MKKYLFLGVLTLAMSISAQSQNQPGENSLKKNNKSLNQQREGERRAKGGGMKEASSKYSLQQAISDKAQLHTIAFSGLAFITGNRGADTFMPPGKVADFFGFQYMRDVDIAGYGHNTTFLSRAANNVLSILNEQQLNDLATLAKEQAELYIGFAYNRFPLMIAFRRELNQEIPKGKRLDSERVARYTAQLYRNFDAPLSYQRALLFGKIARSFTPEQKAILDKYQFNDYNSWTLEDAKEKARRSVSNMEFVAMMTYASEFFSWYKGSVMADTYFCPERHGTYFGGFFMKDFPAMNNPDYFISTAITGDSGAEFLATLTPVQRERITSIIETQRGAISEIARIRKEVSVELRNSLEGKKIDKEKVYSLIERYGYLDGEISALYATRFAEVNTTLSKDQQKRLTALRNLSANPDGGYRFSRLVEYPEVPNTDFLFGVGDAPSEQARFTPPASFASERKTSSEKNSNNRRK